MANEEMKSRINADECVGRWCDICVDVCSSDAIWINNVAHVDVNKCTGCGKCAENICPNYAIILDNGGDAHEIF